MYRSLLYRNFLSEKDNAIALMRPAWQVQTVDGEGEKKIPLPFLPISLLFLPNPYPFRSLLRRLALLFKAQHSN